MSRTRVTMLLGCMGLTLAGGCGQAASEPELLKPCDTDAECGPELECICVVCTRRCSSDSACADVSAGARCAPRVSAPFADYCQSDEPEQLCVGAAETRTPLLGRPYDPAGCYGAPQLAGESTWNKTCLDIPTYALDPQVNCWLFPTTCLPDGFIDADINPLIAPLPCNRTDAQCR